MDILSILLNDHQEIRKQVRHTGRAENHATWSRRVHDLIIKLIAHHASEEEAVFKRLDNVSDIRNHRSIEISDHNSILNPLYALEETSSESNHEDTIAAFSRISDQIEEHFNHEETVVFPLVKIAFSTREMNKIGKRMMAVNTETYSHMA